MIVPPDDDKGIMDTGLSVAGGSAGCLTSSFRSTDVDSASATVTVAINAVEICKLETFIIVLMTLFLAICCEDGGVGGWNDVFVNRGKCWSRRD